VGRLKEKYLVEGVAEYRRRLSAHARVDVIEVPDESFGENSSPAELEKVKEKEGERLLSRLRPGSFLIALDVRGSLRSTEEMAEFLQRLALEGKSDITFAIGGTLGLPGKVLERAAMRLSFSRMTFPHQLVRLVLLEQLYRWFEIARGEPYHK